MKRIMLELTDEFRKERSDFPTRGEPMKNRPWMIALVLLLMPSLCVAEPNAAQIAKARGLTLGVSLEEAENSALDPDLATIVEDDFCGHPHNLDPEIAFADVDDLVKYLGMPEVDCRAIQTAMRQALSAAATGQGSFPPGCNPNYPGVHAVAYWVDYDSYPAFTQRRLTDEEFQGIIDAQVFGPLGINKGPPFTVKQLKDTFGDMPLRKVSMIFSEEIYRQHGVLLYEVFTGENGQHNIHKLMRAIPGSTIGLGWFPDATPCPGDHVQLHTDVAYNSSFRNILGLDVHELGHCLKLQHFFTRQDFFKSPMSYRYRNQKFYVGYVNDPQMATVTGLPVSPEVATLRSLYGGEEVGIPWKGLFSDEPTDPTDPTNPSTGPIKVGDEIIQIQGTQKITLRVTSIDGDEGPGSTFEARVREAYAAIPSYNQKDTHRARVAEIYHGAGDAVSSNSMTVQQAHQTMKFLRSFLVGNREAEWKPLFDLADTVTGAAGFTSVADGLDYNPTDEMDLGPLEIRAMQAAAQQSALDLPPEVIQLINVFVDQFIQNEALKTIIKLVLSFLVGFGDDGAIQKAARAVESLLDSADPTRKIDPATGKTFFADPEEMTRGEGPTEKKPEAPAREEGAVYVRPVPPLGLRGILPGLPVAVGLAV